MACAETMFLGYNISHKGITIDNCRIKALTTYPKLKTTKHIKQFLGLAGYNCHFVQNFSEIVEPLKIVNINNLKRTKKFEVPTVTRYGRILSPRFS